MIDLQTTQGDFTRFNDRKTYLQAGGPGSGRKPGGGTNPVHMGLHKIATKFGFTHTGNRSGMSLYSHPIGDNLKTNSDGSWSHTEPSKPYSQHGIGSKELSKHLK
jgi:hypothetical protein